MSATGWRAGGAMGRDPYMYPVLRRFGEALNKANIKAGLPASEKLANLGGGWRHNPLHVAYRGVQGAGLASAVGTGNFLTRNYRQKPIVGLTTATHKRVKKTDPSITVALPSVSARRSKNILLRKIKAMPYRRKKSTYKRKSRPRRRRHFRKRNYIPLGFPRKKIVRFRLFANGALSGAGGALATAMIKANSLNDPMGSAGSQVPHTLDQWSAFYEKYTVLGSKIKIRYSLTTNTGPVHVGVHLHKNNTALTGAPHYREVGLTKLRTLTTQKDTGVVVMKYSGKRFWHLGSITSDSEQEASFSTTPGDPTDIAYYHLFLQDVNGSNNSDADYSVELEFICMLNEPINIARSSL